MVSAVAVVVWSVVLPGVAAGSISGVTESATCMRPPVSAPITTTFARPACPYCAGHRTVDFAVEVGAVVTAPVSGLVTFAGRVAGTSYITMSPLTVDPERDRDEHARLVTLGGVAPDDVVVAGSTVSAGQRIGTALSSLVRLSLRRIVAGAPAEYLDPEAALARWRGPVRLIPDPGASTSRPRTVRRVWSCRHPL